MASPEYLTEGKSLEADAKQQQLRSLLSNASQILIEHGAKEWSGTFMSPTGCQFTLALTIERPQDRAQIFWEGIGPKNYADVPGVPKLTRIVFENILIDDQRHGRGNPALSFDCRGEVVFRLEDGGISRDHAAIVRAITSQITLVRDYFYQPPKPTLLSRLGQNLRKLATCQNS